MKVVALYNAGVGATAAQAETASFFGAAPVALG